MRARSSRAAAAALALVAAGCDATGPGNKDLAEFILDFCSGETPAFVAIQNEGGLWTRVTPNANGTIVFNATPKFALAVAGEEVESGPFLDVVYGTRDEFSSLNGVTCLEQVGTKSLNGTASGVSGAQAVDITMAWTSASALGPTPVFQILGLPNRPLDLVAHRRPSTSGLPPDRIIVRRALSFTSGATLSPPLDFSAADLIANNTLTITGLVTGETNVYSNDFITLSGTLHTFVGAVFSSTAAAQPIYGVPAAVTQSGDVHEIGVFAGNSTGTRGVLQWHRNPGDRTAALGAQLSTPNVSTATTTPSVLMRAQLPSQADYGGFASVNFSQDPPSGSRSVSVTKTSGYTSGTPTTWDLEMPDLSAVTGLPANVAFVNGTGVSWFAEAGGGGASIFVGGSGTDGLIVKFADAFSMSSPTQSSRTRSAGATRRSRLVRTFLSRIN